MNLILGGVLTLTIYIWSLNKWEKIVHPHSPKASRFVIWLCIRNKMYFTASVTTKFQTTLWLNKLAWNSSELILLNKRMLPIYSRFHFPISWLQIKDWYALPGADLGRRCRGSAPPPTPGPEMTFGFLTVYMYNWYSKKKKIGAYWCWSKT